MLDLAARGVLELREQGPDEADVHLPAEAAGRRGELAAFERRLFDQVRRSASSGVVPGQALRSGHKDRASAWWKRFERDVFAAARSRGLSRDRWGQRRAAFAVALLVPATLTWLVLDGLLPDSVDENDNLAFVGGAALGGLGSLILLRLRDERDTSAGREAAARWLGLRRRWRTTPV
jgi:predicted membrane protein DUF2207